MTDHKPEPHIHDAAPVKNPTEARQGSKGTPMLYVLFGGIALVALAFVIIYSTSSVEDPPPSLGQDIPAGPSAGGEGTPEGSRIDLPPGEQKAQ